MFTFFSLFYTVEVRSCVPRSEVTQSSVKHCHPGNQFHSLFVLRSSEESEACAQIEYAVSRLSKVRDAVHPQSSLVAACTYPPCSLSFCLRAKETRSASGCFFRRWYMTARIELVRTRAFMNTPPVSWRECRIVGHGTCGW